MFALFLSFTWKFAQSKLLHTKQIITPANKHLNNCPGKFLLTVVTITRTFFFSNLLTSLMRTISSQIFDSHLYHAICTPFLVSNSPPPPQKKKLKNKSSNNKQTSSYTVKEYQCTGTVELGNFQLICPLPEKCLQTQYLSSQGSNYSVGDKPLWSTLVVMRLPPATTCWLISYCTTPDPRIPLNTSIEQSWAGLVLRTTFQPQITSLGSAEQTVQYNPHTETNWGTVFPLPFLARNVFKHL